MTDNNNADVIQDLLRRFGAVLNKGVYFLLGIMYQIFFNVSSAQLFESETIKNFYGRIQLIIGVFMIFKLAISILQGIMDPEKFTSPKEGFGTIITRIIISLSLLTVLVPISIPNAENGTSYEKYINNNGLLFGTLYSLQDRILSNNTLGRLILGTTDNATEVSSDEAADGLTEADKQNAKLEKSARIFASTILKGFLRINLLPAESRQSDDETNKENWYCGANLSDEAAQAVNVYKELDIDPSTLLSDQMITSECEINDNIGNSIANVVTDIPVLGDFFGLFVGKSRYVFAFEWLWSLVVGAIFLVILVGFTVDIAIRSIKLAILRLLAPIPVISYIEPKSSKDGGMFSSWVKALTSTYLDLFLRLAIVYFVIFLIQDMIINGIVINEAGGMVGILSAIFIWIGLFFFAKMAPKFIKDALGLKGAMTNVGLSGMVGGAAAFVGGGGIAGAGAAMLSNMDTAAQAAGQGKQAPPAWQSGSDLADQIKTGDPKAKGGIVNSINDRLMREAGVNRARKLYGVTASGLSVAKDQMFADEKAYNHSQDLYDRFVRGNMDTAQRNAIIAANGGNEETARQALMSDMESKKKAYSKSKGNYEDAKKFADSHRISPSFEEEHRRSWRERLPGSESIMNRPDMYNERGKGYTAHQRGMDRILGSREDWEDYNSPRTDNRWSPYNSRNLDANTMHDNPNRDIDTPTAGGGHHH